MTQKTTQRLQKALDKGWEKLGIHSSYSSRSHVILYHPKRQILGKIPYNTKNIPEITE